jgi:hypothetical protein
MEIQTAEKASWKRKKETVETEVPRKAWPTKEGTTEEVNIGWWSGNGHMHWL